MKFAQKKLTDDQHCKEKLSLDFHLLSVSKINALISIIPLWIKATGGLQISTEHCVNPFPKVITNVYIVSKM